MKVKPLLEDEDSSQALKQFALKLQGALLDRFDDLEIELVTVNKVIGGFQLKMTLKFEDHPKYRPDIHFTTYHQSSGFMVSITRVGGRDDMHEEVLRNFKAHEIDNLVKAIHDRIAHDISLTKAIK